MILVDTGPIVAAILKSDRYSRQMAQFAAKAHAPLLTTQACLTESMHLLGRSDGWPAQEAARQMIRTGFLLIHRDGDGAALRAIEFMERFRDMPCDYADATLLIAAEEAGLRRILTFDKHFHAYRLTDGSALNVLP